ncbi:MAG: hypothetical protein ACOH2E_02055 [Candidatus Paracaedibacter sp.]
MVGVQGWAHCILVEIQGKNDDILVIFQACITKAYHLIIVFWLISSRLLTPPYLKYIFRFLIEF